MKTNPIPSLSRQGWIQTLPDHADRLMSYFFTSAHSQSYLYKDKITSLPKLIQEYGHDESLLNEKTRDALRDYFSRYYDFVEVETDVVSDSTVPTSKISISLTVLISHQGEKYNLGRLISTLNGTINKITEITNG